MQKSRRARELEIVREQKNGSADTKRARKQESKRGEGLECKRAEEQES